MLTIYYANSPSWRALKAGALVFLGLFAWMGSSIVLSYRPEWTALHYLQAYGFLLVGYGPLHHLLVIPVYQRLRRKGTHISLGGHLHLPNGSLALFFALVIVLGTFPAGPMTIDFASALEDSGVDVDPTLLCVQGEHGGGTDVHCHLSESEGIDRVVVRSGGRTLLTDEEPPFDFTLRESDLDATAGETRFVVDLLEADGSLIRRYTRTLSGIDRE